MRTCGRTGRPAHPRAYESGTRTHPGRIAALSQALGETLAAPSILSEATTESLYDRFLSPTPVSWLRPKRPAPWLLGEIDTVMEMIEFAMGTTDEYNKSLADISTDLGGADRQGTPEQMVLRMARADRRNDRHKPDA